jgi:hypothetical protein
MEPSYKANRLSCHESASLSESSSLPAEIKRHLRVMKREKRPAKKDSNAFSTSRVLANSLRFMKLDMKLNMKFLP